LIHLELIFAQWDRDLVSVFCIWISSFPSTPHEEAVFSCMIVRNQMVGAAWTCFLVFTLLHWSSYLFPSGEFLSLLLTSAYINSNPLLPEVQPPLRLVVWWGKGILVYLVGCV
jgi:hypothetical protein